MNEGALEKKDPAEKFNIEFGDAISAQNALRELGYFLFRRLTTDFANDSWVEIVGERSDGTKATIRIERGPGYKTPKELEDELKECRK